MDCNTANSIIDAAKFLVSSLMICAGFIGIAATILILNRMFHRWWKPVQVFSYVNALTDKPQTEKTAKSE
jgi:hypothetical protein